jgi:3-phosphoshikimate 1-carboxyvinyltransferase
VHVAADEVPGIIDELPLLVLAAAFTRGESRFDGLAELRVKESDRLDAILDLLDALGIPHELEVDSLVLRGDPGVRPSRMLDARNDHRLALLHAVLALRTSGPFEPDPCVAVSWPGFYDRFGSLVARTTGTSR